MTYEVGLAESTGARTVVVAATTTWPEFGSLWRPMLDEVWACLRANGIDRGARNVMVYRDDRPAVEVGACTAMPCVLTGRIVESVLPSGPVAVATHVGSYADVNRAHRAVTDWCAEHHHELTRTRWEVYGPHDDDPAKAWTQVYWQLAPRSLDQAMQNSLPSGSSMTTPCN